MSLQDYEILGKLGSGSFGIVYKAKDKKKADSICVLKEIDISKADKRMKEWALGEAKIMKEFNSKYIVKYYHSFLENSKVYIAMEYCSKGDLSSFIRSQMGKLLKEELIWKFALQTMIGLRDLHHKKILHRDLKTLNIFLDQNMNIRIGDLGVAKTMKTDFTNTIVGTPYYLSPEMCEEKPYNEKTDIWAMGCLIYELCTFKHPFEASNQAALALKIIMGKYPPIPAHYSKELDWVIKSCLSVDHKRRPTVSYLLSQFKIVQQAKKLSINVNQSMLHPKIHQIPKKKEEKKERTPKIKIIPESEQNYKKIDLNPQKKSRSREMKPTISSMNKSREKSISAKQLHKNEEKSLEKNTERSKSKRSIRTNLSDLNSLEQFNPARNPSPKNSSPKHVVQHVGLNKKEVKFQKPINDPRQYIKTKEQKKASIVGNLQKEVSDDDLTLDFGITPEKKVILNEFDLKKIKAINWQTQQQKASYKNKNNIEDSLIMSETPHNYFKMEEKIFQPKIQSSLLKSESPQNYQKVQFELNDKKNAIVNEVLKLKQQDGEELIKQQKMNELPTIKMNELPTIKLEMRKEEEQILCQKEEKQQSSEEDIINEQIDDNVPFIEQDEHENQSDDGFDDKEEDDQYLIEKPEVIEKFIQEEESIKQKDRVFVLERKIQENQKRMREILKKKDHQEHDLLQKITKDQLQNVIQIIQNGSEAESLKILGKWTKNQKGFMKFYRILFFNVEIERCESNIADCTKSIKKLLENQQKQQRQLKH